MFPLHVHSFYSLLRGTLSPKQLCELAVRYGYRGLALTDRDNLYGLWPFVSACKRANLKSVIGAELSDSRSQRSVVCLVKNQQGYSNLCNLISRRHQRGLCLHKDIAEKAEGLLLLVGEPDLLDRLYSFRVDLVVDLGPFPDKRARQLREWARDKGVPAVVTPSSALGSEEDIALYCLLRAVAGNCSISESRELVQQDPPHVFERPELYMDRFSIWPEVVEATETLADICAFSSPSNDTVMPPWRGGKSGETAVTVLRQRTYEGAYLRYGQDLGEPVVERLEHELRIIEDMGFSSYFLVVQDIIYRSRQKNRAVPRRICGRGSGAASLVAYCLGVTNVCPLKYNLYFERFLNPGRKDPPDIDIDFSWDERDEVLSEVLGDFSGQSAMVCNHIFFKPRMAIREAAKAYGMPGYEISRLSKRFSGVTRAKGETLLEKLRRVPSLKDQDFSKPWPEVLALAERLIGLPRYLSIHPGGVIITPGKIEDYVPVEFAAKGVPIIQWEKDSAEEAGLIKIDILGNRSLGVIRDCLDTVAKYGGKIDELSWNPEDDPGTKSSVSRGATMGCFYIESPAMRLLQQKASVGAVEELVIQSSIIRPAANEFVREYVRRFKGGNWQPLHPEVGDVLDETYGLMVYQEDVSRVAVAIAGFSHGDADGLRKVMSKKDKELELKDYRDQFYRGCEERNVTREESDNIWRMMMSFDGYSFCKPHSASYARVSYQAAYLKHHYPAEFMAAVISNQGGYYSTFAYVSEAKRRGITILHPDVNCSYWNWKGRELMMRVGLQSVNGLSAKCCDRIFTERSRRPFDNAVDFWKRVEPADDEARALIDAGAMDSLDKASNRTMLLWQWSSFKRTRFQLKQNSLFNMQLPPPPRLPVPDKRTMLIKEYEVLGFLCRYHPIMFYRNKMRGLVKMAEVPNYVGHRIECAGWLLTGKLVSTSTGEVMEFLTFEDDTAIVETTFFPAPYRRAAHLLQPGRGFILSGLVEEDYGAVTLTVEQVRVLGGVQ